MSEGENEGERGERGVGEAENGGNRGEGDVVGKETSSRYSALKGCTLSKL